LRLEALIKRSYFDARDAFEGAPKEKRRKDIGVALTKHVSIAPPSRLLALIGQAMKWQQQAGLLLPDQKIDVFRGVAKDAVEEKEQCPTMVSKTIKFGEKSHPECAVFSPDGQYCVSGSVDGFVEVWDYQTAMLRKDLPYQEEGSFMMHDKAVIAVCFSKDSELLATGSQDGQVKVWRVSSGQCARRYEKAHNEGVTYITWSKDSTQILTASFDHTVRAHGLKSGKTLKEYRGHTSYVNSAVYTRDNAKVITGSSDGHVIVFDAKTTESLNTLSPPPPTHMSSTIQYAVNIALIAPQMPALQADEDDTLILVCTRTNTILLMNEKGQVLKSFSSGRKERGDFVAMCLSPKGEWLYACAEDHRLYCFSIETGALEQTMKVAEKEVIGLAHHPTRNIVAVYAGDGTLAFLKP
jgi:WD40 repeat-containing protein SMU1